MWLGPTNLGSLRCQPSLRVGEPWRLRPDLEAWPAQDCRETKKSLTSVSFIVRGRPHVVLVFPDVELVLHLQ